MSKKEKLIQRLILEPVHIKLLHYDNKYDIIKI